MIKTRVDEEHLAWMEVHYPGILKMLVEWELLDIPPCPHCGSQDTADVQVGFVGYTMYLTSATTKFHMIMNGPKEGQYFCNACRKYFGRADEPGEAAGGFTIQGLRDPSLQAYKDWIRGMLHALKGDDSGSTMTEEEWVRDWKAFWAKAGNKSGAADK
jgi:hypothetical protein